MTTATRTMPVSYLGKIPNESLLGISKLVESIAERSEFLSCWMADVITAELERRTSILDQEVDVPHEAQQPQFPIDIPAGELAAVLECLHLGFFGTISG